MSRTSPYEFQSGRGYSVLTFERSLAECKWGDIDRIGSELKTKLTSENRPQCLIDLSRLDFMGSSIVALIVRLWKTLQELGGGMVVVISNRAIREVLEIAGLTKVWTICDTRAQAEQVIRDSLPKTGGVIGLAGLSVACLSVILAVVLAVNRVRLAWGPATMQAVLLTCGGCALLGSGLAIFKGSKIVCGVGVLVLVAAIGFIGAVLAGRI